MDVNNNGRNCQGRNLGPVVQSIVSLTMSLRRQLVSICQLQYKIQCNFLLKNVRIFCNVHLFVISTFKIRGAHWPSG